MRSVPAVPVTADACAATDFRYMVQTPSDDRMMLLTSVRISTFSRGNKNGLISDTPRLVGSHGFRD